MTTPAAQTATATPATPDADKPAVQGGLEHGMSANPRAAPATPAVTTAAEAPKKKVMLNGREFDSHEAALAYAEGLTAGAKPAAPTAPAAPAAPARAKPSDILFENPEKALADLKAEVKQELRQEDDTRTAYQREWDTFWNENQDLKGCEDVVEIIRQQNFEKLKVMAVTEARRALATEARARLAKIRGNAGPGEQLPSKPATVAGASGPNPPAIPAEQPKTSTFIDEFKAMQSKRGKKVS